MQNDHEQRSYQLLEGLQSVQTSTLNVLEKLRIVNSDPNNLSHSQSLSQSTQTLAQTVNSIVDHMETIEASPWLRECDSALQQIQSVRHLFTDRDSSSIVVPLNQNSYYESLSEVTNEARRLGDGMNGMAHYARQNDVDQLCVAVRTVANAVSGLAQNAAQSAYLIGVGDPQSEPGRVAIYDTVRCNQFLQSVKQLCNSIITSLDHKSQVLNVSFQFLDEGS